MTVGPLIALDGRGTTVTVALQVLLQPPLLVTVSMYVPAVETVMQRVVAPLLQR